MAAYGTRISYIHLKGGRIMYADHVITIKISRKGVIKKPGERDII